MDLDMDSGKVLYGVGAVLGVAAVLYFGTELILGLAPAVKSLLLLLGFAALFVGGTRAAAPLSPVLYVLSATAYISFLGYTIGRYSLTADQTFLALGLSSVLFIGLGYAVREERLPAFPVRETLLGIGIVAAGLLVLDVTGPDVTTDTVVVDEVTVDEGPVTVAEVTATNRFVFARPVDVPRFDACLYRTGMEQRRVPVSAREAPDLVPGNGARTFDLTAIVPREGDRDGNATGPVERTYAVERLAECPDARDTDTIVITPSERLRD